MSVDFKIYLPEDKILNDELQLILSHSAELLKLVIQQENLREEKVS